MGRPETIRAYLDTVQEQIRWKRARPVLARELEQHLTDQRDAFQAEGSDSETAERLAVEEMGDPVEVGAELDRVHRPKPQRGLLAATLVAAFLGGLLRMWLALSGTEYYGGYIYGRVVCTAIALTGGTACLLGAYFLDYTWLTRHARWVYAGALVLGVLFLEFSPYRNGASYFTRYVVLLYPTVYAVWMNHWRGKQWKGFFISVLGGIPLAVIGCLAPYMMGVLLLVVTGFALLFAAAGADWFGMGRKQTAAAVLGLTGAMVGGVVWQVWKNGRHQERLLKRLVIFLYPELDPIGSGYQAMWVRKALSVSRWLGEGAWNKTGAPYSYEWTVPAWDSDFLLTTAVYKLGWLPGLLLVLAVAGLLVWLFRKCLRQRNQAGRMMALSVVVPLGVQLAFSVTMNLGYVLLSATMPMVVGNLATVVTMSLIGLALSVFREEPIARDSCPERRPISRVRLSLRNEEDAESSSHVLGIFLTVSHDEAKAAGGPPL